MKYLCILLRDFEYHFIAHFILLNDIESQLPSHHFRALFSTRSRSLIIFHFRHLTHANPNYNEVSRNPFDDHSNTHTHTRTFSTGNSHQRLIINLRNKHENNLTQSFATTFSISSSSSYFFLLAALKVCRYYFIDGERVLLWVEMEMKTMHGFANTREIQNTKTDKIILNANLTHYSQTFFFLSIFM